MADLTGLSEQAAITELERRFPHFQVWIVHRYIGGPVWCARRWDDLGETLNAHSPDELREYLEGDEQETER